MSSSSLFSNMVSEPGLELVLVGFMILTSVALVGIAFERGITLGWVRMSVSSGRSVLDTARSEGIAAASAAAGDVKGPVKAVLEAGLSRATGQVPGIPARAMARERKKVVARVKARAWMLATAGALMPFVGLFGTVIGVMESFQAIGESGQGGFAVVSVGISQALVATAVGIAVALEGVFLFNLVQSFTGAIVRDLALLIDELDELIVFHGGGHAGRSR